MMTVTEEAKAELKRTLESRGLDPGQCLRLAVPPAWTGQGAFGVVIGGMGAADNAVDFDFTYPIRQAVLWFIGLFGSCVLFMGCCAAGLGNRRRR